MVCRNTIVGYHPMGAPTRLCKHEAEKPVRTQHNSVLMQWVVFMFLDGMQASSITPASGNTRTSQLLLHVFGGIAPLCLSLRSHRSHLWRGDLAWVGFVTHHILWSCGCPLVLQVSYGILQIIVTLNKHSLPTTAA